jgi:anti-sigma28 factor (negative regulator of flagellin synthesis)
MIRAGRNVIRRRIGLKKAIKAVKRKPTRGNISKAQKLLRQNRKGPLKVKVKGHAIKLRPILPRKRKVKKFKEAITSPNYKMHLRKQADALKMKIKDLKLDLHALAQPLKKEWPIEYSLLDPPDESMAKLGKQLLSDLKPFLKPAVEIKEQVLREGRTKLVDAEKVRWKVNDFLDDAKRLPLLPEMYRFIE